MRSPQRPVAPRVVVGSATLGETKELAMLKRGFDGLRTPSELEMLDTLELAQEMLTIDVSLGLTSKPTSSPSNPINRPKTVHSQYVVEHATFRFAI